jgi:hypothetical protein
MSGAASATDEEQAYRPAITALDDCQDCLTEEYEKVSRSKKMTEQESVVYVGGVCIPFRESHRVTMRNFFNNPVSNNETEFAGRFRQRRRRSLTSSRPRLRERRNSSGLTELRVECFHQTGFGLFDFRQLKQRQSVSQLSKFESHRARLQRWDG